MLEDKLIQLYFHVCAIYEEHLQYDCVRFTNNNTPKFTDCEVLTSYLFMIAYERRRSDKEIYDCISRHYYHDFPDLPSYQAYNQRINRLSGVLPQLCVHLIGLWQQDYADQLPYVPLMLDSMPIVCCSAKRKAKVGRELICKGYCATKSMYYYGVKLHGVVGHRKGTLAVPIELLVSGANEHDLTAMRASLETYKDRQVYLDKAYSNKELAALFDEHGGSYNNVIKLHRGHDKAYRERHGAFIKLYNREVSKIRQGVETFFNWLIEKTQLNQASKVRSTKGIIKHVFGRIAAAVAFKAFEIQFDS